jgi:hypothetical protein
MDLKLDSGECVLIDNICAKRELGTLRQFAAKYSIKYENDADLIRAVEKYLEVDSEYNMWVHPILKRYMGHKLTSRILKLYFKPRGPYDKADLLSNSNIDAVLGQWSFHSKDLFGKKFKTVEFHMSDFLDRDTTLKNMDLYQDVIAEGFDCFGVVFNTDKYSGGGKHWLCLYGDFGNSDGSEARPYTMEYFNSSGNKMLEQVNKWFAMQKIQMKERHNKCFKYIYPLISQPVQYSKTECGMWSLIYIRSRLEGKPPKFLYESKKDDKDMINYRKYIFLNENKVKRQYDD